MIFSPATSVRQATTLLVVGAILCATTFSAGAAQAGKVLAVRGATTVQAADGSARILGRGEAIEVGDVLSTGRKSFAILSFSDGTKMTLRPQTVFKVEQWSIEPNQETAVTRLFKGGLRAITGFITKRNSRAFRINTAIATIGIRGTTFDARLCEGDCQADAAAASGVAVQRSQAVGRVGFVKGDASARRKDADFARPLEAGSPLYEGDIVTTRRGAFSILVFKDRGRGTLRGDTVFEIESLHYDEAEPEKDSAIFRLVRGGLRAVTGLMGKRNANRVRYRTAIATIGIRGTGFDLICIDACGAGEPQAFRINPLDVLVPQAHAQSSLPPGLLATPWLNAIYALINGQPFEIPEGKVIFIPLSSLIPQELPQMPFQIKEPKPGDVEVDENKLFNYEQGREGEPGLHVACIEGTACAVGDEIIAAGETLYTSENGDVVVKSEYAAGFLVNDKYFKTINIDPAVMDLLFDPDNGAGTAGECTVN